ncbi:MAG TPA: GNAT family protein [Rhodanobacteraceae bacterium]
MSEFLAPVTLCGQHATLEPLTHDHVDALARACADGKLWELWYTSVPRPQAMADYVDHVLAEQADGAALPFAVRSMATDEIVGCTRYMHVDASNRHVEIGGTWYAQSVQRTGVNTECKAMLLRHAFETMGCIRVELRTHWMNHASRAAIARLGAKQEGLLRNDRILADGSYRDTVVFSIIASEWPAVRRHLNFKLERNLQS